MELFTISAAAVLGAIIGSFSNVLILRFHAGAGIGGRSACPACGHVLTWYELIPVVSYIIQGGRCRACRSRISIQYPLVEIASAAVFAGLAAGLPSAIDGVTLVRYALQAVFATMLLVIFVYDAYHTVIPDVFVGIAAGAALLEQFVIAGGAIPDASVLLAGPVYAAPIAFLWYVSRGRWIGLGDAKLALAIGWFFGLAAGGSVMLVAVWLGALIGLALIGIQRVVQHARFAGHALPRTMKSEIPFGPFIIASAGLHAFTSVSAMDVITAVTVPL